MAQYIAMADLSSHAFKFTLDRACSLFKCPSHGQEKDVLDKQVDAYMFPVHFSLAQELYTNELQDIREKHKCVDDLFIKIHECIENIVRERLMLDSDKKKIRGWMDTILFRHPDHSIRLLNLQLFHKQLMQLEELLFKLVPTLTSRNGAQPLFYGTG